MRTGSLVAGRGISTGQPFFLVMSILLVGIAIFGFSHTVPGDVMTPGFPALLWVHAAAFTAWLALMVLQPALVAGGSLRMHRRFGWAGAALAGVMVVLAAVAILLALWADTVPPFYPHGLFLMRGIVGLLAFAGLVGAGVLNRRRPDWHKRLMLCASIVVVVPGLERSLPLGWFGTDWPFAVDGTIDVFACLGPLKDLASTRRIHPAYGWGLGAILGGQATVYVLASSPFARYLLHALGAP